MIEEKFPTCKELFPHHFEERICSYTPHYKVRGSEGVEHEILKRRLAEVAIRCGWKVAFEVHSSGLHGVPDVVGINDKGAAVALEAISTTKNASSQERSGMTTLCFAVRGTKGVRAWNDSKDLYVVGDLSGVEEVLPKLLNHVEPREGELPSPMKFQNAFGRHGFDQARRQLRLNNDEDPRVRRRIVETCRKVIWDKEYGSRIVKTVFDWFDDQDLANVGLSLKEIDEARGPRS